MAVDNNQINTVSENKKDKMFVAIQKSNYQKIKNANLVFNIISLTFLLFAIFFTILSFFVDNKFKTSSVYLCFVFYLLFFINQIVKLNVIKKLDR